MQLLPGGIGSPVFDVDGRLVGMLLNERRMESGTLSYVLPGPVLARTARELIDHGEPVHGSLGVDIYVTGRRDDRERRQALSAPDGLGGVMIRQVWPGQPAQAAGLEADDVIVAWDGKPLSDWRELVWLIRTRLPGDEVKLTVWRAGETRTVTVKMGQPGQRPRRP